MLKIVVDYCNYNLLFFNCMTFEAIDKFEGILDELRYIFKN